MVVPGKSPTKESCPNFNIPFDDKTIFKLAEAWISQVKNRLIHLVYNEAV